MIENTFFKPTPLYKEFVILDLIEKNEKITQRFMSDHLNISVSMVNSYLDEYERNGYIIREYVNSKTVRYIITNSGTKRMKVLNIQYLKSSSLIYEGARNNISLFLEGIIKKGFKKILLYGAGEVAEILLQVINSDSCNHLEVVAVIDDDIEKQGLKLLNKLIINREEIYEFAIDGILVSNYKHINSVLDKLEYMNYPVQKIIHFFG